MEIGFLASSLASFLFIALAAAQVGRLATHVHLPLITGYLLAGILAGPFIFQFIEALNVEALRFLDEMALAFIAFSAGSEMALDELRGRLRSIGWNTIAQITTIYIICGTAIFLLAEYVPFMAELPPQGRLAAALLASTILAARAPSSAIAIINEMRARGPYTRTVLGVTLVKDVLIVVLFALCTSIAASLLTSRSFDGSFIFLVLFELIASIALGLFVARLMGFILRTHWEDWLKIPLILLSGYLVFAFAGWLVGWSHDFLPYELHFEPLLICLVASFWLTNFSPYRSELRHLLHRVQMPVFVIFFTLVGGSLKLDVLLAILPITLVIYGIRLLALFVGGITGATIASDPAPFRRYYWMAFITQAGVGLGLAKEVANQFPLLGNDFATLMVSVIVLSELTGPPFFKFAIRRMGESHLPKDVADDEILDVVIVGIENQSRQLAERLIAHNWRVKLLDIDRSHVSLLPASDGQQHEHWLPEISSAELHKLLEPKTEVAVILLPDDALSLQLCQLFYEEFGITRQIARLNTYDRLEHFRELGVQVLDTSNAMVHLLDNFVRAPQLAMMVFEDDAEHDVLQVTIREQSIDGLHLRDVVLPNDVLVIAIVRSGHSIVPHGYTNLHLDDELTLVGPTDELEEAARKLGD